MKYVLSFRYWLGNGLMAMASSSSSRDLVLLILMIFVVFILIILITKTHHTRAHLSTEYMCNFSLFYSPQWMSFLILIYIVVLIVLIITVIIQIQMTFFSCSFYRLPRSTPFPWLSINENIVRQVGKVRLIYLITMSTLSCKARR